MSNVPPVDPRYRELQRRYAGRSAPRRPIAVDMLDYERCKRPETSPVPRCVQFLAGLATPYASVFALFQVIPIRDLVDLCAPFVISAAIISILVAVTRHKFHWTGFVPGLLSGVFGSPVILFGICTVLSAL